MLAILAFVFFNLQFTWNTTPLSDKVKEAENLLVFAKFQINLMQTSLSTLNQIAK